ncbi:MAG: hypothetical protein ACXV7J_00175 [Methylomonas sp.]
MDDIKKYYEIMNSARVYLNALPPRKQPSDSTIKQYAADMKRMIRQNFNPIEMASCRKSFYKYRAAWCFVNQVKALEMLNKASKEKDANKKIIFIKKLQYYVSALKKFPPDTLKENIKQDGYISEWKKASKPKYKSKSKKYQVSKLPDRWRERYFDYLKSIDSKYISAVAALSSGCRPAELQNGVRVTKENNGIRFIIESVKTHNGKYGQDVRSFMVHSDLPEIDYLLSILQDGQEMNIKIDSAKNFGDMMRSYSKTVFGKRMKHYVSPYTYRHAFSSLIKSTLNDSAVAVCMGHCNDISQTFYSIAGKASGGFKVSEIQGTKSVKHSAKYNMDYVFKDNLSLRM